MVKVYNIFVSHSWTFTSEYNRFVQLLEKRPYFRFRNYSVPRANPKDVNNDRALYNALMNQIRPVHVVIILAGMYASYRKWIQKEINIAKRLGKPIIGVRPWGRKMTPRNVTSSSDVMVGWNAEPVVREIRKLARY